MKFLLKSLTLLGMTATLIGTAVLGQAQPANMTAQSRAGELLNQGINKAERKDLQGALQDFSQAIQMNPNCSLAYNNRGYVYSQLGQDRKAIADFTAALKVNQEWGNISPAVSYYNRGLSQRRLGNLPAAIADYNEAIRLKPDYAEAFLNRGVVRRRQGDHSGALADYNQALSQNPSLPEAYYNRAILLQTSGDNKGAIADYDQSIRLRPNYADALYNRAIAKIDLGNPKGARQDLQVAAQMFKKRGDLQAHQDVMQVMEKLK